MDTPAKYSQPWSDRLAFDMALLLEGSGETIDELKERHGLKGAELLRIRKDPVFLRQVAAYRNEIIDKGLTFKLKAKAQAEELLRTSWVLIHSPDTSPAVKADLIKATVKWAGLDTTPDGPVGGAAGGVKITINLGTKDEPHFDTLTLEADTDDAA